MDARPCAWQSESQGFESPRVHQILRSDWSSGAQLRPASGWLDISFDTLFDINRSSGCLNGPTTYKSVEGATGQARKSSQGLQGINPEGCARESGRYKEKHGKSWEWLSAS